jgi:transposase InsO family protein
VQQVLRLIFSRWGMPGCFRVDNGTPWGSAGDWPTDLARWLIGLGVGMHWNPPRRPQDNGVIERSQGTGKRWTEPGTCHDAQELQERVDEMDRIQREVYPSIQGESRWHAFPELQRSPRSYSKAWERREWDLELVLAHLRDYSVVRRVDCKGQVSLYNRLHYVGEKYRGQNIYVVLDPLDREWVFTTAEDVQLRRKLAEELSRERIMRLQVSHRPPRRRQRGKTQCRD